MSNEWMKLTSERTRRPANGLTCALSSSSAPVAVTKQCFSPELHSLLQALSSRSHIGSRKLDINQFELTRPGLERSHDSSIQLKTFIGLWFLCLRSVLGF